MPNRPIDRERRSRRLPVLTLCLPAALAACERADIRLGEPEIVAAPLQIRTADSIEDRFGLPKPPIPFGAFRSTLPPGWSELPPERLKDLQARAPNGILAWVTKIEGTGGGPVLNLQRWAVTQLGMSEMPRVETLPRTPWLGGSAYVVELEHEGQRLEGRMVFLSGLAVFVRIAGTDAELDPIRADFESWADSIQIRHGGLGASWQTPAEFELKAPRSRTLATYAVSDCEAWVLLEGSDLGGVEANLDRWLGQVGASRDDGRTTVESITLGGVPATLLRARGERSAMDAVYCFDGEKCVTLKMTGPVPAVEAARQPFDAWIASFAWEGN